MAGAESSGNPIPAIGIDLGTTYSCVGYWNNDCIEIIPNDQGNRTTPSCVAFTEHECLVGDAAKNQVALNSVNTIFDAKRLIGKGYWDELVQSGVKLWPFKVTPDTNDRPMISVTYMGEKKKFSPEQISSMVLKKMKEISEDYIGSEVKDAVVTVPAYFNQSQRQATMDAAKIAGINVLCIINEPTAAAIAYGFENPASFTEKKTVLVFDLGGGTFDVSVLEIENSNFQVKATAGDGHLGGNDFDDRMVSHYIKLFNRKHSKKLEKKPNDDIGKNPKAVRRLRTACEKAKRVLSSASETRIEIDSLFEGIDFVEILTRSKFEKLNLDLFNKCNETVERCLSDAHMKKSRIDHVVLVGGSSRIPKVQQLLKDLFNGKELSRSIHQDEAVAYGAAVQAAFLSGHGNEEVRNLVLMEVTPLSLGIETVGDVVRVLIPRNTPIPTRKLHTLSTNMDNQTVLCVRALEGERARSSDNQLLGVLRLTDLPMASRGEVKVEVCFDLQASGILKVSARSMDTGKKVRMTVSTGKLPTGQVEKRIEEAARFREDDQKLLEKNEARRSLGRHVLPLWANMNKANMYKKQKPNHVITAALELMYASELREVEEYEKMEDELKIRFK